MKSLTKEGQQAIDEIAGKYDLKSQSVEAMVKAIVNGNGTMAQFNIPELGGNGQWMKGGMTMVGDMFNNSLKATVDKLCTELSALISSRVIFEEQDKPSDAFKFSTSGGPWPSVFGNPTSSGSQNNFKYAYFAPVRRLVIEENGKQLIYDTKHHNISGVSQQQGSGNSYKFTSQDGPVDVSQLPLISEPDNSDPERHEEQTQEIPGMAYDVTHVQSSNIHKTESASSDNIIATIEKISALYEKGHITEEEFKAKKQELLARL
ncbi:SHOCT domain-containing protein [Dyadobacter sp. NIV53]|uniref:SHOCT domain-containing protein n=1 Tax=Dyadobacter sp. NIV53 TaxID=2861765 RepID=UPI001C885628|nr:SHOCT domain-containing protein [Dyadobacter sp. NIV53]